MSHSSYAISPSIPFSSSSPFSSSALEQCAWRYHHSFLVSFYGQALLSRNNISKLCLSAASPSRADMKYYFLTFLRGLSIVGNPQQTRPFTSRRSSGDPGLRRPSSAATHLPIRVLAYFLSCLLCCPFLSLHFFLTVVHLLILFRGSFPYTLHPHPFGSPPLSGYCSHSPSPLKCISALAVSTIFYALFPPRIPSRLPGFTP